MTTDHTKETNMPDLPNVPLTDCAIAVIAFEPFPCRHCDGTGLAVPTDLPETADDFCESCDAEATERWVAITLARTYWAGRTMEWRGIMLNTISGETIDLRDGVSMNVESDEALLRTLAWDKLDGAQR